MRVDKNFVEKLNELCKGGKVSVVCWDMKGKKLLGHIEFDAIQAEINGGIQIDCYLRAVGWSVPPPLVTNKKLGIKN